MLVCVCVRACVGVCVRALRIVSRDKILRFIILFIIIIIIISKWPQCLPNAGPSQFYGGLLA